MAELNFGLLNPPGSQSIGNAFAQGMDQAAAARAQENQNALAQYQLSAAQRSDQTQNAVNRAYQESIGPEGQIDYPKLQARLAAGGAGSAIPKLQAERATAENLAARTEASKAATATSKFNLTHERTNKAILDIADLPDAATAVASIDRHLAAGDIDEPKANALKAKLGDPTTFLAGRKEILRGMLAAKDRLAQDNVSTKDTDMGGYISRQKYDAQGVPVGDPIMLPKTAAPSTEAAMLSATVRFNPERGQFENIAPRGGMSLRQPVPAGAPPAAPGNAMVAPPAPLAAPVNSMIARPAATAPSGATADTRGYSPRMLREIEMERVKSLTPKFDVSAGGFVYPPSAENPQGKFVAVAGIDGKPLTESQGNATAFGLRMKESEAILADLANPKTGDATLRGANVESIPFVGGAVGKVLPSFLGGSNEQQQQVVQAKTNFITAVLRKESGAAIGENEFTTEDKKYFPQLNDGPKVIKQKENARRLAIEAMKFQAGPGAKEIDKYVPSVSSKKETPNLSEPPPGAVRPRGSR